MGQRMQERVQEPVQEQGQDGWRKAWEQALDDYGDMVYRLALVRIGQKQDAEDVTQNVFLLFAGHLAKGGSFTDEEHEKAWLLRVTLNQSKNLLNSAWFRRRANMTEEIAFSDSERSEVYEAVQSLPERYRTVIHLYYYEGYHVREIAQLTGRKENTVKSLLKRGREQLKKALD